MAGHADGGLKDALQLDRAAADLVQGRAAGAETGAPGGGDAAAEQLALFSAGSVFGQIKVPGEPILPRTGPGRPRGSINRTTKDLVKLIEATGRHPLLAMAEIVAMPIDIIAATLGCKKIEAAEYHRKVMADLAPYVAQKMPTMIQPVGANAGYLIINTGAPVGPGAAGLDITVIDGEQANVLISLDADESEAATSHGDASHGEAK